MRSGGIFVLLFHYYYFSILFNVSQFIVSCIKIRFHTLYMQIWYKIYQFYVEMETWRGLVNVDIELMHKKN